MRKIFRKSALILSILAIAFTTHAAALSESCAQENNIAKELCSKNNQKGFSVCVHEKLTQECLKETIGELPEWSPDISSLMEIEQKVQGCRYTTELGRQCYLEGLSETCMKQVEAGAGSKVDAACKEEKQKVAESCAKSALLAGQECLQSHLSQNCKEQNAKFLQHTRRVRE